MSARLRLGVDIGGTKTEAVVVTPAGDILAQARLDSGFGPDAVVATTLDVIRRVCADAGIEPRETSIGVGIPGAIDTRTGTVSHAINLGLEHLPLRSQLREALGADVSIENDVNAAALGAFHIMKRPAESSMAYLNLGTGLAAGLVLDGQLWRGARGAAGEIGHILVDPNGPLDLDGQRGGLEAMASGSGIARQWGAGERGTVTAVLDAADAGDERAIAIRTRLHESVAAAVRILVLTVDVDVVVIGGGISRLGERLTAGVEEVFAGWASVSPFIASLDLPGRMLLLPDGAPVAALGAAWLGTAAPAARETSRG
ncbi:ROK family protein [Salinibacterium sp. SYSU T00001]|uniref:ROK family protein n=1 Tax=Homoserinimonas sedimenticola TaxID=2986805 RepID=UPI002235A22F|nr:ROK family protein [Salinibacterium sedimenticola]MCW4386062.1 ROK family protein [Salinibacterium sedimenticola]